MLLASQNLLSMSFFLTLYMQIRLRPLLLWRLVAWRKVCYWQHACNAVLVFRLLRVQFWGFMPRRGNLLHRWGKIWCEYEISPHRCMGRSMRPKKWKLYTFWRFFKQNFQDLWAAVQIWVDSLKGFQSYRGFNLGCIFPKFSAPPSSKTVHWMQLGGASMVWTMYITMPFGWAQTSHATGFRQNLYIFFASTSRFRMTENLNATSPWTEGVLE